MEVNGNEIGIYDGLITIIVYDYDNEEISGKRIIQTAMGTENDKFITLNDCLNIVGYTKGTCVVIFDDYMRGEMYQYGRYEEGKWYKYGETIGFV